MKDGWLQRQILLLQSLFIQTNIVADILLLLLKINSSRNATFFFINLYILYCVKKELRTGFRSCFHVCNNLKDQTCVIKGALWSFLVKF